jgi:hypothetical protein
MEKNCLQAGLKIMVPFAEIVGTAIGMVGGALSSVNEGFAHRGTVRVLGQKCTLEDTIDLHALSAHLKRTWV